MQSLLLFIATIVSIFVLDMIWLGFVAKGLYNEQIGLLLRKTGEAMTPIWPAACMVYLFIALGVVYFVLPKANGNYLHALINGMLLGAILYGVYDFTNYSILTNWPLKITLIDFAWGMILCGLSSVFVTYIQNRFWG